MKDYKRLTKWSELGTLHVFDITGKEIPLCDMSPIDTDNLAGRLAYLEEKIECGEIDYVAYKGKEIARLTAENDKLQKRLDNAVELPCIEPMTTWDWDDTTGLGKNNFGKYWQVLYRDKDGEFIAYIGATKDDAEARLVELKGGKE